MALDFLVALAWPVVVIWLLLAYKSQVGRFLDEVTDVAFPGGSLKRQRQKGDEQMTELKDKFQLTPAADTLGINQPPVFSAIEQPATAEGGLPEDTRVNRKQGATAPTRPAPAKTPAPPITATNMEADDALLQLNARTALITDALSSMNRDFEPDPQARIVQASRELLFAVFGNLPYVPTDEDLLDLAVQLSEAGPMSPRLRKALLALQKFAREVERGQSKVSDAGATDYVTAVTAWLMDYMHELQREERARTQPSSK